MSVLPCKVTLHLVLPLPEGSMSIAENDFGFKGEASVNLERAVQLPCAVIPATGRREDLGGFSVFAFAKEAAYVEL